VLHTHTLPDAVTMAGITAFIVAPYGINAFKNAAAPGEKAVTNP
jgi:hypothetical protein